MQYSVVLVEDNPADVDVVKLAIQQTGLDVNLRVLTDGAVAMDYVHSLAESKAATLPDLMILDLSLPWATGDEILRECRSNPKSADVPVIVTSSAIGHPAYFSRMRAYGADRVFEKPMEMERFLQIGAMIRDVLEHRATLGAQRAQATKAAGNEKRPVRRAGTHKLAKRKPARNHRKF